MVLTMKVTVRFYIKVKEFTGESQTTVELQRNSTLHDLIKKLAEKYGKPFEKYILDSNQRVKPYIKIFLKATDISKRGLDKKLEEGSSLSILPDLKTVLKEKDRIEIYPVIEGG
jgi:molybdopterin converting factor small subunit